MEPEWLGFANVPEWWRVSHAVLDSGLAAWWGSGTSVNDIIGPIYNPNVKNPTDNLLYGGYTYDASNGSRSGGDVYRVRN